MKKALKIFCMFFMAALLVIFINLSAISLPICASIKIDGDTKDWENIKPMTVKDGKVTSLSAAEDRCRLYILIKGRDIGAKNIVYIDIDNNNATGYSDNDVRGADYCLDEDDNLFRYTGDNSGLVWSCVGAEKSSRNAKTLELAVDLMDLGLTGPESVRILFHDWVNRESIPLLKDGMAPVNTFITGYRRLYGAHCPVRSFLIGRDD